MPAEIARWSTNVVAESRGERKIKARFRMEHRKKERRERERRTSTCHLFDEARTNRTARTESIQRDHASPSRLVHRLDLVDRRAEVPQEVVDRRDRQLCTRDVDRGRVLEGVHCFPKSFFSCQPILPPDGGEGSEGGRKHSTVPSELVHPVSDLVDRYDALPVPLSLGAAPERDDAHERVAEDVQLWKVASDRSGDRLRRADNLAARLCVPVDPEVQERSPRGGEERTRSMVLDFWSTHTSNRATKRRGGRDDEPRTGDGWRRVDSPGPRRDDRVLVLANRFRAVHDDRSTFRRESICSGVRGISEMNRFLSCQVAATLDTIVRREGKRREEVLTFVSVARDRRHSRDPEIERIHPEPSSLHERNEERPEATIDVETEPVLEREL